MERNNKNMKNNNWIPLEDKLPEFHPIEDNLSILWNKYEGELIVTTDTGIVQKRTFLFQKQQFLGSQNVVAWMHFPKPYKTKNDDKEK